MEWNFWIFAGVQDEQSHQDSSMKETKYEFNAMQTYNMWCPQDGSNRGTFRRLNEQLNKQFDRLKSVIDQVLARHHVAKSVAYAMLAEVKSFWTQLFKTEITDFYFELLGYAYGEGPYPKQIQEACWSLVMKMLRVFFDELAAVRIVACEAHLLIDELDINGVFLYATLEELRVMRTFVEYDFRRHPKFYSEVVMFLFETYLPKSMYEKKKDNSNSLTIQVNAIEAKLDETERKRSELKRDHDALVNTVGNIGKQCGYVKPGKGRRGNGPGKGKGGEDKED